MVFLTGGLCQPQEHKVAHPLSGAGADPRLWGGGLGDNCRYHLDSVETSLHPSLLASLTVNPLGHFWGAHPVTSFFPQVEKLVKYLDPNDLGRINFKDFCRGVFAMKGEVFWERGSSERSGSCPAAEAGRTWVSAQSPPHRGPRSLGWVPEMAVLPAPHGGCGEGLSLNLCCGVPTQSQACPNGRSVISSLPVVCLPWGTDPLCFPFVCLLPTPKGGLLPLDQAPEEFPRT